MGGGCFSDYTIQSSYVGAFIRIFLLNYAIALLHTDTIKGSSFHTKYEKFLIAVDLALDLFLCWPSHIAYIKRGIKLTIVCPVIYLTIQLSCVADKMTGICYNKVISSVIMRLLLTCTLIRSETGMYTSLLLEWTCRQLCSICIISQQIS